MSITLRAKRILTGALAGALVLGLLPAGVASANTNVCDGAGSAGFPDSASATHQGNIDCIAAYDVISGRADGTFGGSASITRGQFATMIAKFAEVASGSALPVVAHPFTDVAGNVHADNIARVYGANITSGRTATTFAPNATITRAEAASLLKRAHEALGVSFAAVTPATNFTDVSGTHAANINLLAGAGVISGKTATTFGPSQQITRAETATLLVRSANQVLVVQGKWSAAPLTPATSVNIVTARTGDPVTSFNYSDGAKITTVTVGANDVFFVDGVAQNAAAFNTALTVGDEVVVQKDTPATGRQTISLTNRTNATFYTTGMINNVNTGAKSFNIVEPVSGVTLNAVANYAAALTTYQIDGASATLAQFEAAINDGDVVTIGGTSSARVYSLSNRTVTGKVSNFVAATSLKVTTSVGLELSTVFAPNTTTDVVILDGVTVANKANNLTSLTAAAVRNGDTVSVGRNAGVLTISVTRVAPAEITGVVAGNTLTGLDGGNLAYLTSGTADLATVVHGTDFNLVLNGVPVTTAVFVAGIRPGDAVSILPIDAQLRPKGTITVTSANKLSGKVAAISATTVSVQQSTGTNGNTDNINYTAAGVDNLFGNPDANRDFVVNGATVTQAAFVAEAALVTEEAKTATIEITNVAGRTRYALTTVVNADKAAIDTVGAVTPGPTTQITVNFDRKVRFAAAFAASDFTITHDGDAVTAVSVTPITPADHATAVVITVAQFTAVDAKVISVTLNADGAAKIVDLAGSTVATGTKTVTVAP